MGESDAGNHVASSTNPPQDDLQGNHKANSDNSDNGEESRSTVSNAIYLLN